MYFIGTHNTNTPSHCRIHNPKSLLLLSSVHYFSMDATGLTRKTNIIANVSKRFNFEFTRVSTVRRNYHKRKLLEVLFFPEVGLFTTSLIRTSNRSAYLHLYRTGISECYLEIQIGKAYVVTCRSSDTKIVLAGCEVLESKDTPPELKMPRVYIDFPVSDDAFRLLDGFSEIQRGLEKGEKDHPWS